MSQSKLKLSLSLIGFSLFTTTLYAMEPGLYLGAMLGPASNAATNENVQLEDSLATTPAQPKTQQFGTRVFVGYDISQYFGVEGGFTYFSNVNYDAIDPTVQTCGDDYARAMTLDLMGKLMTPTVYNFGAYVKAGVAAVFQTTSSGLNPATQPDSDGSIPCGQNNSTTGVKPAFGLGASYDLSQNWLLDLSYNKVMIGGEIGSFNFIALGISYYFVDKLCGQFLCDD